MGRNKRKSLAYEPLTPSPETEVKTVVPPGMETQALTRTFDKEVRPLIDLIDRLRGFGLDKDINLPAVAVIGDQSAGKSSVLEAISGVQLPRGTGIVTRCALEMRMKHSEKSGWTGKISYTDKYGKEQSEDIEQPENVGFHVKKAQKEMTDNDKGISDELITLEVTSPDVPDLTLIDLPGIARNAVEGQPYDIESRIKALIRKYIKRQETIILAVLQCNVDIATCEALKMAKEFDDEGGRTLGVLTKPDLLDRGAESGIMRILDNVDFPLSKGYIVVKCRGQAAVAEGQSLGDALDTEKDFFQNHAHFGLLSPSKWGIPTLSSRLSRELKKHIKNLLPSLKDDVRAKLLATEHKLHELGEDPPGTPSEKRQMALKMVTGFMDTLVKITRGERHGDQRLPDCVDELYSVARNHFKDLYKKSQSNQPDVTDKKLIRRLEEEMNRSRGREFSNYMGKFELVESEARTYVMKMQEPAIKCFDDVHDQTTKILKILAEKCFEKFPDFAEKAKEIINKIRKEVGSEGREEIGRYFIMETDIYTQDLPYNVELSAIEQQIREDEETKEKGKPAPASHVQVQKAGLLSFGIAERIPKDWPKDVVVRKTLMSLVSYYQVATRRLCDVVPMYIRLHVFREQVDELRSRLMEIASDDRVMQHIEEDPDMAYMRSECKSRHERLQLAEQELEKI